ncbi:MAG: hypothetical protein J7M09_07080 [Deltaproteobacteria bacterium]|nr:hypothetical protein [Candidatus Tharpella sp.]
MFFLALVIALSGFTIAALATKLLKFSPGTSAGLLAGGLTSSPTLAAAQEAIRTGNISLPQGFTADAVIGNITTGYAITYIFGLAGLIAIIKLLPGLLGLDLAKEAKLLEGKQEVSTTSDATDIAVRVYRINSQEITQMKISEIREKFRDGFTVTKIERNGETIYPQQDDFLQIGDEVTILGSINFFLQTMQTFGEEITHKKCLLTQPD